MSELSEILVSVLFLFISLLFPLDAVSFQTETLSSTKVPSATASSHLVTRVVDGDTIKIASGEAELTVRIIGINTPETVDPRKDVECYGKEASEKLSHMITQKSVVLISDPSQAAQDYYGRLLRYVELNGTDVGEHLIAEGYAHEYTYDSPYERQDRYQAAEEAAREADRGLWSPEICP